ncbi:MAG: AAA family ATPase [Patiriisocius sp.]|uniref:AAA family ATPase n=1 Tax=Patiriisocius sp. TaxID=2822396 RepID=UPI003EFA38C0
MKIIGRIPETRNMQALLKDNEAHFLAMIGRRRVGKTFLIREIYKDAKIFEMTGIKDADLNTQLLNFTFQMNQYFETEPPLQKPDGWLAAFHSLSQAIKNSKFKKKPVVFFDELPWIATRRSGFTEALAHWWNNWASQQNIVVVVCGSAASWMLDNVVNAKGGLHNRITKLITLMPFTLQETKQFLTAKKITLTDYQIIQLYLAIGGIPHYLNNVEKGKSTAQNIQELCFSKDGVLRNEFDQLYAALFDNSSKHIQIIKALASKAKGLDRQEILSATNMTDGGWFSKVLKELESSGFITTYEPLENKKKQTLFRLTDEYSLFYLKFMDGKSVSGQNSWMRISESQAYKIWVGYAFESLCMKHVENIKNALGISAVETNVNSFLHVKDDRFGKGFQIDLLIDRKDDIINICEMKFYADEFTINIDYAKKLRTKLQGLKTVTNTKKAVHLTFISTYGVLDNKYKSEIVTNDLTTEIFFD